MERSDRVIEESKNPLQPIRVDDSGGESHSFLSFNWGTPLFKDTKQQKVKLKRSDEITEDRKSSSFRMSLQGMSSANMLVDGEVSLTTDKSEDLLFISYSAYFDSNVFMEEFLVNLLHPFFSFWVHPYMHQFNSLNRHYAFYVQGIPILLLLLIISRNQSNAESECILPIIMFTLHKVAIAFKYASLHPCEYKKLKDARDEETVNKYQAQLQMISAWLGQNVMVMDYEIKCAAAVSGSDIDHTMIVLPMEDQGNKYVNNVDESSQLTTWRDFLLENGCDIDSLPRNNAGNHMITVHELVRTLLNEANQRSYGRRTFDKVIQVVVYVLTFLPFMFRGFVHHGSASEQSWGYVGDVLYVVLTPLLLQINLTLIFVPIFDVSRRKKLAKLLNYMTTVSTIRAEQKVHLPIIDMFRAQNVYGWMYTRLVIQSFGKRMLGRLDNFISTYIVVVTFSTIFLIVSLFTNHDGDAFGDSTFTELCLLILIVLCMICSQVYLASQVNEEFAHHKVNVILNEMKANSRWLYVVELQEEMMAKNEQNTQKYKILQTEKFRLEETMKAMKRTVEAIAISNEQNPLCVLGMKADMSILISILTAIATLISSIISVAMRQNSSD